VKYNKVFCILALALIFSLLMLALPATPALAAVGSITLSPATGSGGTIVTVNGTLFTSGSTFTVKFDTATVATGFCDGTGNLFATFTVPTKARGQYPVTVTTDSGDTSNTINFTITPKVTPSPLTAYVGDTVTVTGSGFKASSSITIYFDSTNVGTATADTNGSFSGITFTIPESYKGTHTVKGEDTEGASPTVNLTISPKVIITPASGAVGDTITVRGTGFAASSSVTIYFDTTTVDTATTNTNGTFPSTTFTIPSTSRGNHTIKAQDASTNYATATLAVASKITITPSDGAPGMTVTVTGTGFDASKTITIKYNAITVTTTPAIINTDASGNFTASFTVPTSAAGTYTVQASDNTNTASANFTITINVTLSETTSEASPGHVGMDMTISGAGFKPNTEITIRYTSTPIVVATKASNSEGAFSVTFKIPASEAGTHTISASDGTSTMQATFFMESTAPATPTLRLPATGEKAKSRTVFDWENVTEDVNGADELSTPVTYDLQVASDATFTDIVLERTGLTTSGYTLLKGEELESTKQEAPYYWRVRAVDAASNTGDWTSSRTFYVSSFNWVLYGLIGAGILVVFFIGFAAGRKGRRSYY
jgi:hypothetical protein